MPNWCTNSVVFSTPEGRLEMIHDLFAEIQQKQEADGRYHLPDFAVSEGFMRDIVFEPGRITFTTRSSPNISLLAEIADHYDATFVNRYMEMGDGLYGEARYDYHTLAILNLDQEELRAATCYDPQKKVIPMGSMSLNMRATCWIICWTRSSKKRPERRFTTAFGDMAVAHLNHFLLFVSL